MLSELRLQNFRCFEGLSLELGGQDTVFIGENAQGKTSILEAVCLLVRLHSPRASRMGQMVRFKTSGLGVAGLAWEMERQVRYAPGRGGGVQTRVDGEERGTGRDYLQDGGLVVWMGNEDLNLIRGPGDGRRHYLDFLCSQVDPAYRQALSRYSRALKARNLLLKDPVDRGAEIRAYTEILVEQGTVLQNSRSGVIDELEPALADAQREISGRDEALTISYKRSGDGHLAEALDQALERDRQMRQTNVGPHRDDLELKISGLSARMYASEGQQRTAALALKLGQGQVLQKKGGRVPLFLLDDIFGELDARRRNALMDALPGDAQKLITTTTLSWLDQNDRFAQLLVKDGTVVS